MVLFQDIIHVNRGSASAPFPEFARFLQLLNGSGIRSTAVHIDALGGICPAPHNASCRKHLAAIRSRLGDSMKSIVSPAESTARYRYTRLPATRTYVSSTRHER